MTIEHWSVHHCMELSKMIMFIGFQGTYLTWMLIIFAMIKSDCTDSLSIWSFLQRWGLTTQRTDSPVTQWVTGLEHCPQNWGVASRGVGETLWWLPEEPGADGTPTRWVPQQGLQQHLLNFAMWFLFYLVEICGVGNVWQVRWDSERTIAHLGKPRAGLDQMILDNLYQQMEDHTPKNHGEKEGKPSISRSRRSLDNQPTVATYNRKPGDGWVFQVWIIQKWLAVRVGKFELLSGSWSLASPKGLPGWLVTSKSGLLRIDESKLDSGQNEYCTVSVSIFRSPEIDPGWCVVALGIHGWLPKS